MDLSRHDENPSANTRAARPAIATASMFLIGCLTFAGMLSSAIPFLILGSGICLIAIIALLWTTEEPPILLLPALFQWSEVALVPISTVWLRVPLAELSENGADLNASALYGLLGVLSLAVGMKVGSLKKASKAASFSDRIRYEAMRWPQSKVFQSSAALILAGYVFAALMFSVGPLREPFGQAANVKYIGIFMLAYWCLLTGRSQGVLAFVIGFEIVIGMTGFFAEFKDTILTFFVAALFAKPRVRAFDLLITTFAAVLILGVAIFWSAIKPDYRDFMNNGTGAQTVGVPMNERIDFIGNSISSFDGDKLQDGFQRLVSRHGYIEYLGLVMQNVPQAVPFQDGQITASVIKHITVPRLIWKEKPALPSDTEVMSKYTGLPMTWNSDTSISIGYLGELYADFGYLGGLVAASLIGLLIGLCYRAVSNNRRSSELARAGLCLMLVLPIAYFGTAYVKLIGSYVMTAIIVLILLNFVFPRFFRNSEMIDASLVDGTKSDRKFSRI